MQHAMAALPSDEFVISFDETDPIPGSTAPADRASTSLVNGPVSKKKRPAASSASPRAADTMPRAKARPSTAGALSVEMAELRRRISALQRDSRTLTPRTADSAPAGQPQGAGAVLGVGAQALPGEAGHASAVAPPGAKRPLPSALALQRRSAATLAAGLVQASGEPSRVGTESRVATQKQPSSGRTVRRLAAAAAHDPSEEEASISVAAQEAAQAFLSGLLSQHMANIPAVQSIPHCLAADVDMQPAGRGSAPQSGENGRPTANLHRSLAVREGNMQRLHVRARLDHADHAAC